MSLPARPGVTIIVPVFNYAEFVGQALDSALNQSYPEVDVLVVDDGSTDETPHVLETYGDSIRVVTQDHRGLSAARNTGLRETRHELVAFLDADDVLQPSMVSVLHGTLTLMGESHALAAGANAYIDASGRDHGRHPRPASSAQPFRPQHGARPA
jgi:glycosyltransferase involved in cell wall biosynthesis